MLNETLVEENKIKWYNTKKFKISLAVVGAVVGVVVCGIVVKKSGQRLDKDTEPAKDVLRALASVGSDTLDSAGERLDSAGERLGDLAN